MVVGGSIERVTVVVYPTSRISNERGVVVLDGSVCCSTHPPGRLRELGALRRRERFGVDVRRVCAICLRGSGTVLSRRGKRNGRNGVDAGSDGEARGTGRDNAVLERRKKKRNL